MSIPEHIEHVEQMRRQMALYNKKMEKDLCRANDDDLLVNEDALVGDSF